MNSYYSKLWKGNGMQRLRHYKSAAAPQATEDGVTILTGAQLQLGWAMNSASERARWYLWADCHGFQERCFRHLAAVGRSCEDCADDARHSGMEDLTFRFQAEHLELHGTILADQMRNHSNHFLCTRYIYNKIDIYIYIYIFKHIFP